MPPASHSRRFKPSSAYSPLLAIPDYFTQTSRITPPALDPPYGPSSSGSSYSAPTFQTYYNPPCPLPGDDPRGSVLVCHHGGGEGGLGFAVLAKEVRDGSRGELGVLSWDVRGHGQYPLALLFGFEEVRKTGGNRSRISNQRLENEDDVQTVPDQVASFLICRTFVWQTILAWRLDDETTF